jgi:dihydroorotate dehydrogenase
LRSAAGDDRRGFVSLYPLIRPLAFALDAEAAHRATIAALKIVPARKPPAFPESLKLTVAGLEFASPVVLAAGFDKDAEVAATMLGLGFGFVEVGTVTPRAQRGNPRPRLFRLAEDEAVINRLGFNNHGQAAALERLQRATHLHGIVGVNIGANKDSANRIADYAEGVRAMSPAARYLTINISSPNTPGLRALQDEGALNALLAAVTEARPAGGPPIFLKLAPDLGASEPDQIVRVALRHGIDALIVANTTVSRPPLKSRFGAEAGGLSGAPLKPLALKALREFRSASGGELPLIGVGGIGSVDDAWKRIRAGASLVQLYTAMVYRGPDIARRIARGLAERLAREGFASVAEAVGTG